MAAAAVFSGVDRQLQVHPLRVEAEVQLDDHVQFFLSTFGDGRQAFVFAVNPFGVQMDGAMVEGVLATGGGFGGLHVTGGGARPESGGHRGRERRTDGGSVALRPFFLDGTSVVE